MTAVMQMARDERQILSNIVRGGDVLILGNARMGKTLLAQLLEKTFQEADRRVCVLDSLGSWSAGLSTRRVLRWHQGQGKVLESGFGNSLTTVWNYQGHSLPRGLLDLGIYDDVILDDWRGVGCPALDGGRPRRVVLTQLLDDTLERHIWRYVIVFNLRFAREISFARRWGGQGLTNLGWGLAVLLQNGLPPQSLRFR